MKGFTAVTMARPFRDVEAKAKAKAMDGSSLWCVDEFVGLFEEIIYRLGLWLEGCVWKLWNCVRLYLRG